MATPVGYATATLLGLICKLSEGSYREAALNRSQNLYRIEKRTNRQENVFIFHCQPVLS